MIKVLKTVLRSFLILYYFLIANFLFWGSIAAFFILMAFEKKYMIWLLLANMAFAPLFIYAAVRIVQKDKKRYDFGLYLLTVFWASTQIMRFTLVSEFRLEMADLTNFLLFAGSFGLTYLGKHLDRNSSVSNRK